MPKKPKCPYTFPHRSRAAKVDYLCGIGGYRDRWECWPIEFNVATYHCNLDFDHMLEIINTTHHAAGDEAHERLWTEAVHNAYEECKDNLWEWGVEDARRNLDDSDCYKMLWNGDKPLRVEFELVGRSGKHLVIKEFEGMPLKGLIEDTLRDSLTLKDGGDGGWMWPNAFVDKLYRYVRQCEIDFTPRKASDEVEYQAAWHVYSRALDEWARLRALIVDRDEVALAATEIRNALEQADFRPWSSFNTLCLAAGLSPSAILRG